MTKTKKELWYHGEALVSRYYQQQSYNLLASNYTVRWWELDLVVEKDDSLRFVEVKVINHIDDVHGYVTKKKLYYLEKTIQRFFLDPQWKQYVSCDWSLDVVFVKNNDIFEVYEDVYLS